LSEVTNLQHPHILPLFDSGEADGFLYHVMPYIYYVMPYIEGEMLRDKLNREKQLPVDDALQITQEVADALDFAHQHDVIHRDIKSENIVLGAGHTRVADFETDRGLRRRSMFSSITVDLAGGLPGPPPDRRRSRRRFMTP
jgi:serine/threonine-protein kinase